MSGWLTNGISLATLPLTGSERFPVDTQLSAGANPETEAVSISQLGMALGAGATVPWVSGRFYGLPPGTTLSTLATTTGTLYAYPLYIPATILRTVSNAATTGQLTSNSRVALFADNGAGYPGNLVSDFGQIGSLAGTGVVTATLTTPLSINTGLYWVASIFTTSSTFPTMAAISALYTNVLPAQLGFDSAVNALAASGKAATGITVAAQTYGAFASTFPTGGTEAINANTPLVSFGV